MSGLRCTFIAMLAALPMGCTVGPHFHAPIAPPVAQYTAHALPQHTIETEKADLPQHFVLGKTIPEAWWELFHSVEMNRLIEKGFAHNPTVEAAQAALCAAKANLSAEIGTTLFPSINATGVGQKQASSGIFFSTPTHSATIFNLFNAQANISYMLDLFGKGRRQVEASQAQVDYQRYELEATYLSLAANIVTTTITNAQLASELTINRTLVHIEETLLDIVAQQYALGAVPKSDLLSQETQLAQTRALLPPLEKKLSQTEHALAALIGEYPSKHTVPPFLLEQFHLPETLPLSFPAKLVKQRPDIKASEAQLHETSAQIGIATAQLLPQFTLNGVYGWESLELHNLFSPNQLIWNYALQISQPLFQGGARFAQRKAALYNYRQALAQYQNTVLQAFQNVADVLRAIETDAQEFHYQRKAENIAKALLEITTQQYKIGSTPFINVLYSERQYQKTLHARIQAQAARFIDTAALFQALGGKWWSAPNKKDS